MWALWEHKLNTIYSLLMYLLAAVVKQATLLDIITHRESVLITAYSKEG